MRSCFGLLAIVALILNAHSVARSDILIGIGNPLSGPLALSGNRNRIAVASAVRALNDEGGVLGQKVKLVAVDDACGLERSIEAARQLVDAGVQFVSGHLCSHSSLLAAGFYETADILMITPSSTHPRVTEEGRKNVFRLIGRDDVQGGLAANFLASRWSGDHIAILHDGSTYGEGLAAATRNQLRNWQQTEAIYETYHSGEEDFAALMQRLKELDIETLYVGGYGPDAAMMARAARDQDFDLQIVGGDGLAMDEFWDVAGDAGEGVIFSDRPEPKEASGAEVMLEYFDMVDLPDTTGARGAYATVQVWAQAVEQSGTLDLPIVAKTIRMRSFDTVLGRVAFDDKGDLRGGNWQWKTWSKGKKEPLTDLAATQ